MSKNVLILSASPRKGGNSDTLCDYFMNGARDKGHSVEKIFLSNMHINYCTGCGTCVGGQKACPQKDDMAGILEKMVMADVIVLATPVYFYSMNAQLKTLIDRTCARYTEINDRDFYFIMTMADDNKENMMRTLESLRGFTACLEGADEKGLIFGTGLWNKKDVQQHPLLDTAYQMGRAV